MAVLVLLNNFMHDFSAAGWLFGSFVLWRILREELPDASSRRLAVRVLRTTSYLMRVSLAGIVVFGGVRALAYGDYEWSYAAGESQVTLLLVKHALLATAFVWGLVYYVRARKFMRQAEHEA